MKHRNILGNKEGSVIIAVILILAGLSVVVFMASDDSITGNRLIKLGREYRNNTYRADTGVSLAIESHKETWLKSDSELFDLGNDTYSYDVSNDTDLDDDGSGNKILIKDSSGTAVAKVAGGTIIELTDGAGALMGEQGRVGKYEIARIELSPASGSMSEKFYKIPHTGQPLPGTGFSPKNFEIRRYGIVSTGEEEAGSEKKVENEAGLFKYFTKN